MAWAVAFMIDVNLCKFTFKCIIVLAKNLRSRLLQRHEDATSQKNPFTVSLNWDKVPVVSSYTIMKN